MNSRSRVLAVLLLAAACAADAAIVRLKDGGRIEGTVLSASPQEVTIQTPGGARRIDAAAIQSIEYETAPLPEHEKSLETRTTGAGVVVGSGEPLPSHHDDKNLLSFALGMAAPLSDVNFGSIGGGSASNGDLGPLLGFRYLRTLNRSLAAGAEFEYLHRGGTRSPGLLPRADASVYGDNLLFMGLLRWHLIARGAVRPYLLGGAGVSRSSTRIDAAPNPGFAWTDTNTDESRRLIDGSAWAPAGTARVGVDFDWEFAEPAVFSLEAGWTGVGSRSYAATASGRDLGLASVEGRLNLFVLAARWSVRW